jgi:hypothetical protein
MSEAFTAAFLVAAEAALAAALVWSATPPGQRRSAGPLLVSLVAGLAVGLLIDRAASARGLSRADLVLPLLRFRAVHAVALLGGAFLLRRWGATAPGGPPSPRRVRTALELLGLALGLAWSIPDGMGLGEVLRESSVLTGDRTGIALAALAGALLAAAWGALAAWLAGRAGLAALTPPATLSLLFAVKLVGAGALGAQLAPLPVALTSSVGRIIHDAVHMTFVMAQIPDHPYLRDEVYQAILLLLEPFPHALVAAAAFGAPVALAWRRFSRRPAPDWAPSARAPDRRLLRAAFRRRTRIGGAAFGLSLTLSTAAILSAQAKGEELYEPLPEPVVDDGAGLVLVPQGGPLSGGAETRMRKYVWSAAGRSYTFFTIRRSDGALVAVLDRCEICQPRGYAQLGKGYVFCTYCKTPIPVDTVGQPGGCNPIPLPSARVEGGVLRISALELRTLLDRAVGVKP